MIERIALKTKDSLVIVNIKNIIYFEKEKKNIKVVLKNSQIIYIKNSLKNLQNILEKENLYNLYFFRPHCSYFINLIHIKDIQSKQILMSNNDFIPISITNKKSLFQIITNNLCII